VRSLIPAQRGHPVLRDLEKRKRTCVRHSVRKERSLCGVMIVVGRRKLGRTEGGGF